MVGVHILLADRLALVSLVVVADGVVLVGHVVVVVPVGGGDS